MATKKSQPSFVGPSSSSFRSMEPLLVPLIHDSLTFESRQTKVLKEMERQTEMELKRRRREWEREVERMRDEFLRLHPVGGSSGHLPPEALVSRRRGSTDVIDTKKMAAEHPESDQKFRLRFDLSGFDPDSVDVVADTEKLIVRGSKLQSGVDGTTKKKDYVRKIQKPKEIDSSQLQSHLTTDGILVVETVEPQKPHGSRGRSKDGQHHVTAESAAQLTSASKTAMTSEEAPGGAAAEPLPVPGQQRIISQSTANNPETPSTPSTDDAPARDTAPVTTAPRVGVPGFVEERGRRRLRLVVDIGTIFKPKDVTVQVIKDNRFIVKARHEEISSERLIKSKFSKEFELSERIETESVRGAIDSTGKLLVGALVKGPLPGRDPGAGKGGTADEEMEEAVLEEFDQKPGLHQCNVLNLSTFPPAMLASASSTESPSRP